MKDLRFVLEEMRFFRTRSILVILSIAFAFLAYGVLGTLRFSLQSGDGSIADRRLIVTHRDGLFQTLPLALSAQLARVPGAGRVGHATWLGAYYRDPNTMLMAFAVEPQAWLDQHPDMIADGVAKRCFLTHRDGILVSEALARKFNWKIGRRVPFGSILYPPPAGDAAWSYIICGTFRTSDDGGGRNYIVSQYIYLNENRTVWRDTVGTYVITPINTVSGKILSERIDKEFAQSPSPTSSVTDRAFHDQFFAQFGDVVSMIRLIIVITFVSLILVVSSGMALSVRQSTAAFGLLRVLGFPSARIYRIILGQAAILVVCGATLGLIIAATVNCLLTQRLPEFVPDIVMPWQIMAESAAISLLIIAVVGIVPGWLALRISPTAAFARAEA